MTATAQTLDTQTLNSTTHAFAASPGAAAPRPVRRSAAPRVELAGVLALLLSSGGYCLHALLTLAR